MGRGACVPSAASGAHDRARLLGAVLGALCLLPTLVLLARPGALGNRPVARAAQVRAGGDAVPPTAGVLTTPSLGPPQPPAPRRRRYTLTPTRLHWDHFNLTYRILSFPRNLLSPRETRRGLAAAFRMWSDVSPFSFREVAPEQPSDLRIGGRPLSAPCSCRLLPGQPHGLPGLPDAPLLRRPHGRAGPRLLPPGWAGSRTLTGGTRRRVAHRPGARGGPRDRPRAGPDALAARPGAHAPQRHAAWLEGAVAGRAVGVAPALRLPGPAVRVRVLGAEGFLRRPPEAHEEAVSEQLRLLLRVPLPHGGCHRTAPQDQNPAGARGQECDLPLRPEDPPQERQSVVSDPAWAPEGGRGTRDPAQPSALPAAGTRTRSPWSSPTPATWRWATHT
uniref:Peptidase M10 metallopeptidase domain-containing protein n=1 Tax=Phocoena sinus TaxID=42100 RepID=A0A8C9AYH6_PHOSS